MANKTPITIDTLNQIKEYLEQKQIEANESAGNYHDVGQYTMSEMYEDESEKLSVMITNINNSLKELDTSL